MVIPGAVPLFGHNYEKTSTKFVVLCFKMNDNVLIEDEIYQIIFKIIFLSPLWRPVHCSDYSLAKAMKKVLVHKF